MTTLVFYFLIFSLHELGRSFNTYKYNYIPNQSFSSYVSARVLEERRCLGHNIS